MKLVATLATLLIAAAGVMTFEACNKKDKDSVEPLVQNHRMPLATFDHNHGTMTYSFDLDKINADFNRSLSRTAENRYIVESIEILDDAPTDAEVCPEIKIVVIDTEEEASTTMWFMDTFAEKDVDGSNTVYFLDSEVESGNYVFATKNDDGTLTSTFSAQYFIVPPSPTSRQYFNHLSRLNFVLESGEKLLSSNVVLQFLQIYL